MQRTLVDLGSVGQLHHLAQIHDGDAVGDMAHHQQVVGNEQIGQAQLILQLIEHVDDLGLNGHVQRRYRLIADDEVGVDGQRAGDADTLALSAGELVSVAGGMFAVQPHMVHQLQNARHALFLGLVKFMDIQRLADDVGDRHAWVQGRIGILKDHGGLFAELLDIGWGLQLFSVIPDFAAGGLIQMQDRAANGGLAAAGLAHQTQRLSLVDAEGYAVHRLERFGLEHTYVDIEVFFQVFDFNQRLIFALTH